MRRAALIAAAAVVAGCGGSRHEPQFARLHNGMTKAQVRALAGAPEKVVQIPYPSPGQFDQGFEECWDYGLKTLPKTPLYELCFWDGKHLSSHTKYG